MIVVLLSSMHFIASLWQSVSAEQFNAKCNDKELDGLLREDRDVRKKIF